MKEVDKNLVFDYMLSARIDYMNGRLSVSSYLKGFPKEQEKIFGEKETYFLELMDGVRSVKEIYALIINEQGEGAINFSVSDLENFFSSLEKEGVLEVVSAESFGLVQT